MPPAAAHDRSTVFTRLAHEQHDVLVIGGGITGAGVARDAALRGMRVALVEQDDFASGTSSRSSRLVHGGLRYLEHRELALVFESSRERRTLLRIAPHLVRPLAFTWPVYAHARVRRWQLAAALTLYDALALFRNVQRHERLGVEGVVRHEPRLRRDSLLGGARYFDAATDDARLTLSNVLSAREAGAVVANHARVESLLRSGGRIAGAVVHDTIGGASVQVTARVVVNATGPWSDAIEALAGAPPGDRVRGSKGVHIAVPRTRVGNTDALTLLAPQDGRVMFVLPAGDFTIVGTTDTYEAVEPAEVRASDADVDYLLAAANHFFPGATLTSADVVSSWAGLRPLAAGASGGDDPGAASREHAIAQRMPGMVSVTGGKLTTYRAMAAEVVDAIEQVLGVPHVRASTETRPLPGGEDCDVKREIAEARIACADASVATRLVHAHGTRWRAVWALAVDDPALAQRVDAARPYLLAELRYAVAEEMASSLGDLLVRRVPLAFETRDNGRAAAARIAPLVAGWLGWDAAATVDAVAAYDAEVTRMFGRYISSAEGP
jgi:glycerol-3-phosphate dehydrogenase